MIQPWMSCLACLSQQVWEQLVWHERELIQSKENDTIPTWCVNVG